VLVERTEGKGRVGGPMIIGKKSTKSERNGMTERELDSYGSGRGPMLSLYGHRNKIQIPFLAYCHLFSLN